ncbi:MAG TPA: hypothetical protein ENJ35_08325 [Gammaproteobacteria bacterium]|nr:hypothetical protein [Gammaproteobacteria bacterium]
MNRTTGNDTGSYKIPLIGRLILDYFLWTQRAPMILLWGVGILVLIVMFFTSHQSTSMDLLDSVFNGLTSLPWIGDDIEKWLKHTDGEYNTEDFRYLIFSAWGLISLFLTILDYLRNKRSGPAHVPGFKQRHRRLLGAIILLAAGYLGVYWSAPEQYNGSGWGWMGVLGAFALILYCVSLYAMVLGHFSRKLY